MPALKNQKHEAFAQAVADGASAAEAYRDGWKCQLESAETSGPRLARDVQIAFRISELRKQADEASKLTRQGMVRWLERIITAKPNEANAESDISETMMTKAGPFTALCPKMAAAEKLIKMTGWNEPERFTLEVEVKLGGNAESNGDH